ncbi:MAG TPA: ThuA domain-containing protein [Pirellulaceae bacterium]|jgi:type 1 glutamine amidotransferase/nicotinamidase-related amidase|nr:ThuA domain-containing protein [Pirellulaceae bacterium]
MSKLPTTITVFVGLMVLATLAAATTQAVADELRIEMLARLQVETTPNSGAFRTARSNIKWSPSKTAIVICDMWNEHWCRGATRRVAEMAPRMNEVVQTAREKGVLIIHCPSSCLDFYKDTPMRAVAKNAPPIKTEIPLQGWCHLDEKSEAALPIDDSDGGCDCWPRCRSGGPWKRQIDTIEIEKGDAITDSGEAYYLMKQRGIENVIVMGVHTNMCVLGRPFSIRQMVYQGQNVVLMRDMTDTMYNSRMKPYVPHTQGTDLVVDHIEKYWCPTVTSSVFTGKEEFVFAEKNQPHVVFVIGEREYQTNESLPAFAQEHLTPRGVRHTIIHADEKDKNNFPGLAALKTADLLFLSVRRRSLPEEQLKLVREFMASGKPLVGIRTANHAFHTKGKHPSGHAEWQSFDADVLGGNYHSHHPNGIKSQLTLAAQAGEHAILDGVSVTSFQGNGSLYEVSPLAKSTIPLVIGEIEGQPAEPVAWTHKFGKSRVFYTSLGQVDDFQSDDFNRLLVNAVFWGLNKTVPAAKAPMR